MRVRRLDGFMSSSDISRLLSGVGSRGGRDVGLYFTEILGRQEKKSVLDGRQIRRNFSDNNSCFNGCRYRDSCKNNIVVQKSTNRDHSVEILVKTCRVWRNNEAVKRTSVVIFDGHKIMAIHRWGRNK